MGDYPFLTGYNTFTLFFLLAGSVAHFVSWHKAIYSAPSTYRVSGGYTKSPGGFTRKLQISKLICVASFQLHSADLKTEPYKEKRKEVNREEIQLCGRDPGQAPRKVHTKDAPAFYQIMKQVATSHAAEEPSYCQQAMQGTRNLGSRSLLSM